MVQPILAINKASLVKRGKEAHGLIAPYMGDFISTYLALDMSCEKLIFQLMDSVDSISIWLPQFSLRTFTSVEEVHEKLVIIYEDT